MLFKSGNIKSAFLTALFLLIFIFPGAKANVYPEILANKLVFFDFTGSANNGIRNFAPKEKTREIPFSPAHHSNQQKSQTGSDRCIIKESFRTYADRGNDPSLLAYSGHLSEIFREHKTLIPVLNDILTSSKTGESARIRPPPVL